MILDELLLHNFGLYEGRQTLALSPPSQDKPVVLIGGLNGGGKTTILDALQLCLFGAHAKTSNRGALSYPDYLARCIHRGSKPREALIALSFRHFHEGTEERFRIQRSWQDGGRGVKEQFEVLRNGREEPVLAENWISHVEDFIPPHIAPLFLFDGEQIESYAAAMNSSELIGSAIQNLLGLDIVDQLDKDLQVYERRTRSAEKAAPDRTAITNAEAALRSLQSRIDDLAQERAALRAHKVDKAARRLKEADERYRKLGGELYERKTAIAHEKHCAEHAVAAGASDLREMAAGALPLLIVKDLVEDAGRRDESEEEGRRARDACTILATRDKTILSELKKASNNPALVKTMRGFLAADRKARDERSRLAVVLGLTPDCRSALHALLRDELAALEGELDRKLKRQAESRERAAQCEAEYESVPAPDAIAAIAAERDELREQLAAYEVHYAATGEEIERMRREAERTQQSLTRLLEEDAKAAGARDDRARILRHSSKVKTTLARFRQAVTQRHVQRIERLVFESYRQLLRKGSLVTSLAIDPQSFALTLYGRDGAVLSAERLSAGERQLLAIALLWGLAKASGRPLPTAIDTPLGRLDTAHRMHLIERYFPFASHQVLLLSTDEEITGAYFDRLQPFIGRSYQLVYDDDRGSSVIVPGYFEEREAA